MVTASDVPTVLLFRSCEPIARRERCFTIADLTLGDSRASDWGAVSPGPFRDLKKAQAGSAITAAIQTNKLRALAWMQLRQRFILPWKKVPSEYLGNNKATQYSLDSNCFTGMLVLAHLLSGQGVVAYRPVGLTTTSLPAAYILETMGDRCVLAWSTEARPNALVLLAAMAVAAPVAIKVPTAANDRLESLGRPQTP